ncbi:MAG: flap endonuclease-1 [Nanoarchaeota archaeon]
MGIAFKDLITRSETQIDSLKGKILAIDSYNLLYQFLTTIRARDGTLLTDSKGNTTSHLVGLFARTTKLMQQGLKLAFVFDGKPPDLKLAERNRRRELKLQAEIEYKKAVADKDIDAMKKFAGRTTRLTPDLINEAKMLIQYLGLPIIQAPSEGEAQAAHIVKQGNAYATVSQDYDTLLHSSPMLIRNLSIAGKRKTNNKLNYETVKPELINLSLNLNNLGIDQDQLIALALLVGTDYNIGGIKGIGPKKALDLIKKHNKDFDALFSKVKWDDHFDNPWTDIYYLIKKMSVTDDYELTWGEIDAVSLSNFLVDKHDFSDERVTNSIKRISEKKQNQRGLAEFL